MTPLDDATIVVAGRDVTAAEFSEEVVLLDLRDGMYYGLREVGARVWALLQSPMAVAALRDAIAAEYDVDAARCGEDVRSLLNDLVTRGLVDVCADGE